MDNSALTFRQRMKDPSGQAARYLEILSNYTFDIKHRDGSRHGNADSVSRIRPCEVAGGEPCKQCNRRITGKHSINVVRTRAQRACAAGDVTAADAVGAPPTPVLPVNNSAARGRRRRGRRRFAAALDVTAPMAWQDSASWSPEFIRNKQLNDCDIALSGCSSYFGSQNNFCMHPIHLVYLTAIVES